MVFQVLTKPSATENRLGRVCRCLAKVFQYSFCKQHLSFSYFADMQQSPLQSESELFYFDDLKDKYTVELTLDEEMALDVLLNRTALNSHTTRLRSFTVQRKSPYLQATVRILSKPWTQLKLDETSWEYQVWILDYSQVIEPSRKPIWSKTFQTKEQLAPKVDTNMQSKVVDAKSSLSMVKEEPHVDK